MVRRGLRVVVGVTLKQETERLLETPAAGSFHVTGRRKRTHESTFNNPDRLTSLSENAA
jgi:hypothetical protein